MAIIMRKPKWKPLKFSSYWSPDSKSKLVLHGGAEDRVWEWSLRASQAFNNDCPHHWASQVALMVKNPLANVEDVGDMGSIPGSGRSPEGGYCSPPQCSCLENPMQRGAWWATVHRITQSWTWLKQLSMHTCPPDHPLQKQNKSWRVAVDFTNSTKS